MNIMLAPIIIQHQIMEPQEIQIKYGNQQTEKGETFKNPYKPLLTQMTFVSPKAQTETAEPNKTERWL